MQIKKEQREVDRLTLQNIKFACISQHFSKMQNKSRLEVWRVEAFESGLPPQVGKSQTWKSCKAGAVELLLLCIFDTPLSY
jgi:hypothetical protein